jgi:hypothetical protein
MLVQLLRIARHGSPQRHGVSFLNFLAWATDLRYASDVRSRYPHPEHAYWITDAEAEIHRAADRLIEINARMNSARLRDFMLELRRQQDKKPMISDATRSHPP